MREVKDAEVRKTEIISAAKYLFYTKGYEKTTTQDIVDALKISRGLLYYHFKSKEDILYYIVERQVKTKLAKFRSITYDEKLGAKEKLIQFLDNSVNSEPPDDPIEYKLNDIVHSPENTLMMDRICHQLAYTLYDYFAIILEQGSDEGIFNVQYPNELAAFFMTAFCFVMNDSFYHKNDGNIALQYFAAFKHFLNQALGLKEPL